MTFFRRLFILKTVKAIRSRIAVKEETIMIWVCTKCGEEVESEKRPDLCPMCYAPLHHLVPKDRKDENGNPIEVKSTALA